MFQLSTATDKRYLPVVKFWRVLSLLSPEDLM